MGAFRFLRPCWLGKTNENGEYGYDKEMIEEKSIVILHRFDAI